MRNSIAISLTILGLTFTQLAQGQSCPDVKRMCLKSGKEWAYNVQSKSAAFESGSTYEMSFIAYKGMDYRLSVCSDNEEQDGKIEYEIYEIATKRTVVDGKTKYEKVRNYLIKNKEHDLTPMVEFNSTKTRKMYLKVHVPDGGGEKVEDKGSASEVPMVCVGVLIEQKAGVKTGFN